MLTSEAIPSGLLKGQHMIYFISDSAGHMKIGKTNDISRRMRDLQTGNSNNLILCATILGLKHQVANLEKQLHEYFHFCNTYGEWFEYGPVNEWLIAENLRFSADRLSKILKEKNK